MRSRNTLYVNFHGVGTPHAWVGAAERSYWCDESVFLEILDSVADIEAVSGVSLPITFDDGNLSDATIALPALEARGLTAQFFVCAGRIGEKGYLDRVALAELSAAGMPIGSHGWSHVDWRRIDDAELVRETRDAREKISETVGRPVRDAAIPFGSYDRRVLAALKDYDTVYSSDAVRSDGTERPRPRLSYARSWTAETLARAATTPYSMASRVREEVKFAFKRWRGASLQNPT